MGLGLLLFAKNPDALPYVIFISNLLILLPALIGIYAAYHIFSPNVSPYPLMFVTLLVWILLAYGSFTSPSLPQRMPDNSIDLNMNLLVSIAMFYLLLVAIGSNGYIFTRLSLAAEDRRIRIFSGILAVLGWLGVINVFTRLVLLYHASATVRNWLLDIVSGIVGLTFIIALVIAPKIRQWLRK